MDLTKLSKTELFLNCKELGIYGYKTKNKNELIQLIITNQNSPKKNIELIIKEKDNIENENNTQDNNENNSTEIDKIDKLINKIGGK